MALEPSKHVNGRMWPPGVSGNPNGRPVGSRTVFSQEFLKDLAADAAMKTQRARRCLAEEKQRASARQGHWLDRSRCIQSHRIGWKPRRCALTSISFGRFLPCGPVALSPPFLPMRMCGIQASYREWGER